jgi:hypothetical protein
MLQLTAGDADRAAGSARESFRANLIGARSGVITVEQLAFDVGRGGGSFSARATAFIDTPLLALVGIHRLAVLTGTVAGRGADAWRTSAGSELGTSNEVAVAVDLADGTAGPLLRDLKAGLQDLVDIVVWPAQERSTSRVGLVPFAEAVNAGDRSAAVTGGPRPGLCTSAGCQRLLFAPRGGTACRGGDPSAGSEACATRIHAASLCVAGRRDAGVTDDAAPDRAALDAHYPNAAGLCLVSTPVQPLTADRRALHAAVETLAAGGASAPHLGMAWAWYLLSPEWSGVWPAGSAAASYAETQSAVAGGAPKVRKIAILVQGAGETVQHCQGVDDSLIACAAPAGPAAEQLRRHCRGMRGRGIEVYVVGVRVDGSRAIEQVLRDDCAGRERRYHAVETGSQLRQALRDIALDISPLVVTQ